MPSEFLKSLGAHTGVEVFDVIVGERRAPAALRAYSSEAKALVGLFTVTFDAMDAWFEEEDEIFVHCKDPYKVPPSWLPLQMAFASGSGFGQSNIFGKPAGSTFGGGNTQQSAFGQPATQQPAGGLFGQPAQQQQQTQNQTGSLFGQPVANSTFGQPAGQQAQQQPTGGLFGQPAAAASTTQQPASGGLFGQSTAPAGGGLFGQPAAQPSTSGGGLFGQPATQPATGGGLFGQPATQPATGGGLFGQPATQPATGGGLFGQPATQPATGGGLFGQPATQPATGGGLFGQPATQPATTGGLFGQPAAQSTTTSGGGLFGQTTTQTTGGGLFGQPTGTGGLFGQSTAQPASGGGGLFGQSTTQPVGGGVFGQSTAQPTGSGLFGGRTLQAQPTLPAGGLFGSNQPQQRSSYIQGRLQISKDLHQRKLSEEPLKAQELLQGIRKDLMNISAQTQDDHHLAKDMKSKVDQAVQDTVVAIRLVDAFKAPQGSGTSYLNSHANFPLEFFTRVTENMRSRLLWYKTTIEQIERKLSSSAGQAQTPQGISATLQAQHTTFISLANKTAALDIEFQKIKTFVTQLYRAKTGSVRDPFNQLDRTSDSAEFGIHSLAWKYANTDPPLPCSQRLAHEKVEQQRVQLEEQERQVALLRQRIAVLEGGTVSQRHGPSGNTVDDFSIRNAASQLDKLINRWSSDIVRDPPTSHEDLARATLSDLMPDLDVASIHATPMQTQNFLRHAMSDTISEGVINCLIITNSSDANVQLTRIHEHIFARDPTVASVWRRQTFSAAVEACTPEMSLSILYEQIPELMKHLNGTLPSSGGTSILDQAYSFSRMLHGSGSTSGDGFYRAFVPEIGTTLYPRQIELVKRCLKSERGEIDRVGATIFPGLVKISRGPQLPNGQHGENVQVRSISFYNCRQPLMCRRRSCAELK
ncbi:hypothetical protein C0991_011788 [Blastosporella zonata]|nr:hypothetical protein C0991_011788 [Blastosporella zonata]